MYSSALASVQQRKCNRATHENYFPAQERVGEYPMAGMRVIIRRNTVMVKSAQTLLAILIALAFLSLRYL